MSQVLHLHHPRSSFTCSPQRHKHVGTAAKQTGKQKVQKLLISQTYKLRKMAEVEAGTPCELGGPRRARSCPSDSRCLKMNIGALWENPPEPFNPAQ